MTLSPAFEPQGDAEASLLEWRIASDVALIDGIVSSVRAACEHAGFSSRVCRLNVPVALTEALANAIEQGNCGDRARTVRVTARIDAAAMSVEITDEGDGFDAETIRKRCAAADWVEQEDGRGVFLMHALMDEVETWCDHGHTVRLVLRRS